MYKDNILSKMDSLSYVWQEDFIGYETTPEIDIYYHTLARFRAQQNDLYNCFNPESTFNDLPYKYYTEGVILLQSIALKHVDYCFQFCKTHSGHNLENLLTIIVSLDEVTGLFSSYFNISVAQASHLIDTLTLDTSNFDYFTRIPGSSPAPFIRISKTQALRSVEGCLNSPFIFMLKNLKRKFPIDWSRNVNDREAILRNQLYAFFEAPSFLTINRPIQVVNDKRIMTDIDACIIDRNEGSIGLFQLKWMDPFGESLKERESRKKNYQSAVASWITRTLEWVESSSEKKIADHLGVSPKFVDKTKIKLFVIGKTFSCFSSNEHPQKGVAWGLWYQVVRILNNCPFSFIKLRYLFNELIEDMPHSKIPVASTEEFEINNYRIVITSYRG